MALERIVLNIIPEGEMPVFHCSQYENGRPVIIDLVSSDDDAYVVPEGASVELHCRKVDDNIVTLEPDEVDNNTVTFVSTEQLTACPGDNLCEIVLYADTDPVQTIATLNFILHVEPDPLEGGLTSETQIYNLTEQIEEITHQVIGDDYYTKVQTDALLDLKADKSTTYTKSEVDTVLNLKADKSTTYTKSQVDSALALKADAATTYTKTQVDTALALKADTATTYTKTEVDNALALKANAADVYTKSEVYNKTETYTQAEVNALIDNIFPTLTASGSIATFSTALSKPLVSVTAEGGATTVTRCGVNLWDEEWELGYYNGAGAKAVSNTCIRCENKVRVSPNTTYYIKTPNQVGLRYYDYSGTYISGTGAPSTITTFTTPSSAYYMTFYLEDAYGTTYNNNISINYPSTDTTYHAYNGQTVPVSEATTLVTQAGINNVFADSGEVTVQYKYMSI